MVFKLSQIYRIHHPGDMDKLYKLYHTSTSSEILLYHPQNHHFLWDKPSRYEWLMAIRTLSQLQRGIAAQETWGWVLGASTSASATPGLAPGYTKFNGMLNGPITGICHTLLNTRFMMQSFDHVPKLLIENLDVQQVHWGICDGIW